MNLRILVCLSLALFLTLVLKSSTDFPWVDLSSTTCGYISKCYLFHLQIAFPFILSVHGVQTHYQGKWKWCLQSAVFYTTSSYLLKCWILGMLHIYINKKGKEVHICIYMHTYISVYIYIYIFFFFQVASVVSDSVRPHGLQPTRLLCPWDSPGKNIGVGCHFLLQCMIIDKN